METSYLDFRGETAPAFQRFWEHFRMTPRSILDLASTNARVEQVEYRARTLAAFITAAKVFRNRIGVWHHCHENWPYTNCDTFRGSVPIRPKRSWIATARSTQFGMLLFLT